MFFSRFNYIAKNSSPLIFAICVVGAFLIIYIACRDGPLACVTETRKEMCLKVRKVFPFAGTVLPTVPKVGQVWHLLNTNALVRG